MFGRPPPFLGGVSLTGLRDIGPLHHPVTPSGPATRLTSGGPYADGVCVEFDVVSGVAGSLDVASGVLGGGSGGGFSNSDEWTFETWVYPHRTSGASAILRLGDESAGRFAIARDDVTTGEITDSFGSGAVLDGGSLAVDTWSHLAFMNDGFHDEFLYINGVFIGLATQNSTWGNSNGLILGPYQVTTGSGLVMMLSGVRLSNSPRYVPSTNFTPSTMRFVPDSHTLFLSSF